MARRRQHYEQAFETYLRLHRVPFMSVDEARRTLLPEGSALTLTEDGRSSTLKSFDFVIYDKHANYLADVKGRKIPMTGSPLRAASRSRLQTWVTEEDVRSLARWEELFGEGFCSVFVFLYWCEAPPPDGLFFEVFEYHGRWYAPRTVKLSDYASRMRVRSPKWGTVHLNTADFDELSSPLIDPL